MYIEAAPNRGAPPAVLLRESFRENGRVRKRTLANLSDWPTPLVEGLRTLLKGGVAVAAQGIRIRRALPHGHAAAVLGTIRAIGLDRLLGKDGALVLYDVSSSWLEGRCCELARFGYSRDGKRGKLQIVYGLLGAEDGCPVAIEVFEGNTADPMTLAPQID